MASPPDTTSSPLEDAQPAASDGGESEQPENEMVRVEDGKTNKTKKKRKNPKRGGAAKKRGTGFEEYFCDPPMTPAEHNTEKNYVYPPHRPFVDRIEECIQRFRARRRLGPEREVLFSRYLVLGGIDSTVRQFQGTRNITEDVLDDATRGDVREMTADDVIHRGGERVHDTRFYNPSFPEHWDVDFTGIAAGFVSEHLPKMVGSDMNDFYMGVEVVLNFLKYVDRHDVCPEYGDDIRDAQNVCLRALEEIPANRELLLHAPGSFNTALRVLHCKDNEDAAGLDGFSETKLPDAKYAKICHATTLSILFGPERFSSGIEWTVIETVEHTFKVREISPPDDAVRAKYKALSQHLAGYPAVEPCGTFKARPVIVRDGWDNTTNAKIPPEADVDHEFVLEEDLLGLLTVGTKLTMIVCTLNVGLKFIKYIKDIKPSFYVFLPQELMFNYKEPVLNERPARNVYDLEDEEGNGEED